MKHIIDSRIDNNMFYRYFFRFLAIGSRSDKLVLGRWGYHWEINKHIQKYYD
jgi:hypothetical protein